MQNRAVRRSDQHQRLRTSKFYGGWLECMTLAASDTAEGRSYASGFTEDEQPAQPDWTADFLKAKGPL